MRKIAGVKIGKAIYKELCQTCSEKESSMFKDKRMSALSSFNWKNMVIDLKRTAPILSSVLQNSVQQGVNRDVTITIAAGVLLQRHSERANLLQRVISLLLYASHSPKQVCVHFRWYIDFLLFI